MGKTSLNTKIKGPLIWLYLFGSYMQDIHINVFFHIALDI